ncbi:MAG: sigma-70 family RNA polymerase sigma factor [Anaerolineales bacterium]|nr:sigma-70 family RNA polymerase sigma factor [Anaerolineales bacterium]
MNKSAYLPSDRRASEDFSLDALRAFDKAEFARVVEAYSGVIYRLAIKMLEDPQDAEDVLQETFIKAYHNLPRFDGRSSISTWLYRIATNEALMLLRRRKHIFVSIDEPLEAEDQEQAPLQIVDWCCLPEAELMSSEARAYMDQAVDQLPHRLRMVFLLRDIEGLSTQETAEVLNLSEAAVKTRLSRARMRLREMLSEYHSERLASQPSAQGEGE